MFLLADLAGLCRIHQVPAHQRHAGHLWPPWQRKYYLRTERDEPLAHRSGQPATKDNWWRGKVSGGGNLLPWAFFFIIGWLLEISEVHFRTNMHMSSLQTSMEGCDSCCSCKSFIVLSSRWPLSCLPQCSFRWSITRVSKEHVTFTKGVHIKLHRTEDIGLTGL